MKCVFSMACLGLLFLANQASAGVKCTVNEVGGAVTFSGPLEVIVHVDDATGKNVVFGATPKFSVKVQPACDKGGTGVKDWGYAYGNAGTGKRGDGTTYEFANRAIFSDAEYTAACVNIGKGVVNATGTMPINWSWYVNPASLLYKAAKNGGSTGKSVKVICQRFGCECKSGGTWK
ncbi:hypothetical protein WDW86_10640 [Bdellovibrionota bacterium FG-2]